VSFDVRLQFMNDFVLIGLQFGFIPITVIICFLYANSNSRLLRILIAIITLAYGAYSLYCTLRMESIIVQGHGKGMSQYVKDYLLFIVGVLSGGLGINMLTSALDYNVNERRALEAYGRRLLAREKREKREMAMLQGLPPEVHYARLLKSQEPSKLEKEIYNIKNEMHIIFEKINNINKKIKSTHRTRRCTQLPPRGS
jgi:hypothetical protein